MINLIKMPADELLESRVIGACLTSINAANFAFAELTENDFYLPAHQIIFSVAREAYITDKSLDLPWIIRALSKAGKLEQAGGIQYLSKLSICYSDGDYEIYAKELQNLSQLRTLMYMAQELPSTCSSSNAKADEVISDIHSRLFKIQKIDTTSLKSFKELMQKVSDHGNFEDTVNWMVQQALNGDKPYTGIPSGYPILDDTLGFFRPGAIYYIGARTSMGKTTFLLNLMSNMLTQNIAIGMFSLEMPSVQVALKLNCLHAGIKFSQFEEGKLSPMQLSTLNSSCEALSNAPLFFDDQPGLTIGQLKARAKRMQMNHGIKILMIDYLTLIRSNTKYNNKHMQVDEISKGVQNLAKELNIPILCLAQLNRGLTARKDFTPTLSDFRESGSIEEDADACILLHRPDYYDPMDKPGQIQVIVAKNRIRGIIKKIAFSKNQNSEAYSETRDLGSEVQRITIEQTGRNGYDSPYEL